MPVLHLGVVDVPYSEAPVESGASSSATTTGDVAEILEGKYHLFETFYEVHEVQINEILLQAASDMLDSALMGHPASNFNLGSAESEIEMLFRKFLESYEVENRGIPGVPTKAALRGRSKRFKGGRGPRRPSFIDTGLMENSFKVWVD